MGRVDLHRLAEQASMKGASARRRDHRLVERVALRGLASMKGASARRRDISVKGRWDYNLSTPR